MLAADIKLKGYGNGRTSRSTGQSVFSAAAASHDRDPPGAAVRSAGTGKGLPVPAIVCVFCIGIHKQCPPSETTIHTVTVTDEPKQGKNVTRE